MACRDYTVTQEVFALNECLTCGFILTSPRPKPEELARYYDSPEYISHARKSTSVFDALYKAVRTFTTRWKYRLVNHYSLHKPVSLLDYGCGTGSFLLYCQKNGLRISGVEPSPAARQEAKKVTGAPVYTGLSEIDSYFDAITLWHVLEHVPDLHSTLDELTGRLANEGTLFIAVPNPKSNDAAFYQQHWAGYDVPRHLWHFGKPPMERLLKQHGLQLLHTLPMRLDAYYVSLLSEKYARGKHTLPGMVSAFLQARQSNRQARKTGEYSSLIYIVRK